MAEKTSFILKVSESFARFLTRHPFKAMTLGLTLLLPSLVGLKNLEADFTERAWFTDADPAYVKFLQFEKDFGNDDNIIIATKSPSGIFDKESIEVLQELTEQLWQVTDVLRVDSLTNFQWVHAEGDEIVIEPFFKTDLAEESLTDSLLATKKDYALNHEGIVNTLISEDGKTAMIFARLKPIFGKRNRYSQVYQQVLDIIEKQKGRSDHEFHVTGLASVLATIESLSYKDTRICLTLSVLAIVFLLFFLFGSLTSLLFPVILIALTTLTSLGFGGWIHAAVTPMVLAVPEILTAICVADSIHILTSYFIIRKKGVDHEQAVFLSIRKNFYPTLLTSVTTAIGFFSILLSDYLPTRNMGLLAGVGTIAAWLYTMLILVPILLKVRLALPKIDPDEGRLSHFLSKHILQVTIRHYFKIIVGATLLFLAASYIVFTHSEVNSSHLKGLKNDIPVKVADQFIIDNFGGYRTNVFVIDSGEADGIKDPKFLAKVEELIEWMSQDSHITRVTSAVSIIKDLNQVLNHDDPAHRKIPSSQNTVAEELLLYSMSIPPGKDLNYWTTVDYRKMRLDILWLYTTSKDRLAATDRIIVKANELGLNLEPGGKKTLYDSVNGYVVKTFFSSMLLALIMITVCMALIFGSLKLGLLSMIPNIFPPMFGMAVLTLMGEYLDGMSVVIVSVCLGIAVDDTIHFIGDYQRHLLSGKTSLQAIEAVLSHTGFSLVFTTVVLVAGFGMFAFGHAKPTINFGIISALVLLVALLADLYVLPALLYANSRKS